MTAQEKRSLVKRLEAGREAARRRRPERLRAVEGRMDELGVEYRSATSERRDQIRKELRELGQQRLSLRWGGASA